VDRPVAARRLAELPCPVEGIDDPDAGAVEPPAVVDTLLGEHRVVGTQLRQQVDDEAMRLHVAAGAQHVGGGGGADRGAQGDEHLPRFHGKAVRQLVIVDVLPHRVPGER
jgi:hypothetical protein